MPGALWKPLCRTPAAIWMQFCLFLQCFSGVMQGAKSDTGGRMQLMADFIPVTPGRNAQFIESHGKANRTLK